MTITDIFNKIRCRIPESIKTTRNKSLRMRLCVFSSILVVSVWLLATVVAWHESREYIDEFFDTQQMLFARLLTLVPYDEAKPELPTLKSLLRKHDDDGDVDEEALAFAIFSTAGRMVLHDGEKGAQFLFAPTMRGFTESRIAHSKKPWRIVWLPALDGEHIVAVGQEIRHRKKMAFELLQEQLAPWLVCLPILLAGMLWLLNRELCPLRNMANAVAKRTPADASPLPTQELPQEILPLITALNSFFSRGASQLARERSFTADAAHELRTPLAALRVQAEVAQLSQDDPETQAKALHNLTEGIDRAARLMEQLLMLSRVDGMFFDEAHPLLLEQTPDWHAIVQRTVQRHVQDAAQKTIDLIITYEATPFTAAPSSTSLSPVPSDAKKIHPNDCATILELLFRNLLDNAIRYSPANSTVEVRLTATRISVLNEGNGVPEDLLPRLGERFFRPPGQQTRGSGLGLSIARRIADLHGLSLTWANRSPSGFSVTITKNNRATA